MSAGCVAALAAPGDLDPTFSGDGWVRTLEVFHDDHYMAPKLAQDIALDGSGKIVATGEIDGGSDGWWFGMFRYTRAGELDDSFGDNGAAMTPAAGDIPFARGIAVQPDGKPVVVGLADCTDAACFGIGRYRADGMRDPEFGNDGFVRTRIGWSSSEATSVAIDAQDRILAVGWRYRGGDNDNDDTIAVARYLPDGRLDKSFSGDGKAWFNIKIGDEVATDVHIRPDGRIYITGYVDLKYSERLSDFLILRLTASGRLDTSFSRDGIRLYDVGSHDVSNGSALAPDGDLVLAGSRSPYRWWDEFPTVAVVRFSRSGAVEGSFGKKIRRPGKFGGYASDVAVHPDGDIIVPGAVFEENDPDGETAWFVTRWNKDGSRASTWGRRGTKRLNFGTGEDEPHDIEIDAAGRILVGGSVYEALTIARLRNT